MPPTRLAHADELPLGAHVRWTHLAGVARWMTKDRAPEQQEWAIVEPRGYPQPRMVTVEDERRIPLDFDEPEVYARELRWYRSRHAGGESWQLPNKTVFVWPDEGDGYLFGLVRRGVGRSMPSSSGYDYYNGEWDYDPGGFAADGYIPLYAVKAQLTGTGYLLAPHWAVRVVE